MSHLVLLDAGPVGLLIHSRETDASLTCNEWLERLILANVAIAISEATDYEVRRELIRLGFTDSIRRLDSLMGMVDVLAVRSDVWREAALLWAEARKQGRPTADGAALDIDVIIAAQSRLAERYTGSSVIVATTNVGHLSRFVRAVRWEEIDSTALN